MYILPIQINSIIYQNIQIRIKSIHLIFNSILFFSAGDQKFYNSIHEYRRVDQMGAPSIAH